MILEAAMFFLFFFLTLYQAIQMPNACVRVLTRSLGKKYIVLSMFFTATQQLTWALAVSIHTFPNRYTTPVNHIRFHR